jgi:FkbM family methyltransferase
MDFEPLKPLDPLLFGSATMMVCPERAGLLNCAFFAATPHNPIMNYVLQTLAASVHANIDLDSPQISGAAFFTRAVRRGTEITGAGCRWLPRHFFYPYGFWQLELANLPGFPETYAVHRWASSRGFSPRAKKKRSKARRVLQDRIKRIVARTSKKIREASPPELPRSGAVQVDDGRILVNAAGEFPLITHNRDLGILPSLFMGYKRDEAYLNFLRKNIRTSDHVIDIGANIGYTVLAAALCLGPYGQIDAFEPSSEIAEILRDNIYMNRVIGRVQCDVTIHEVAIGSSNGRGNLVAPARHSGKASLRPEASSRFRDEGLTAERLPVEIKTFSSALPGLSHARFVKIDVEGLEPQVLKSMRSAIAERRIDLIDIEVADENLGAAWRELEEQLRALHSEHNAQFFTLALNGDKIPVPLERVLNGPGHAHLILDFSTGRPRGQRLS